LFCSLASLIGIPYCKYPFRALREKNYENSESKEQKLRQVIIDAAPGDHKCKNHPILQEKGNSSEFALMLLRPSFRIERQRQRERLMA
jgi:hypothetical protein